MTRFPHGLSLAAALLVGGCAALLGIEEGRDGAGGDGGAGAVGGTQSGGMGGAGAGGDEATSVSVGGSGGGGVCSDTCVIASSLVERFRAGPTVEADGSVVTQWVSEPGGVGSSLVTSPGQSAPSKATSAELGDVMRFEGPMPQAVGHDEMNTNEFGLGGVFEDQDITIVVVATLAAPPAADPSVLLRLGNSGNNNARIEVNSLGHYQFVITGGAAPDVVGLGTSYIDTPVVLIAERIGPSVERTISLRVNGNGMLLPTDADLMLSTKALLRFGLNTTTNAEPFEGDLAEVVLYTNLPTPDRDAIEECLSACYGISL